MPPKRVKTVKITHIKRPFEGEIREPKMPLIERLIAGKKINFNNRQNDQMVNGGIGGRHGTLGIRYDEKYKLATIMRSIPKKHRGKGIGTYLLLEAERIARKNGMKQIGAGTEVSNIAAIKTYEKIGWKKHHEDREYVYYTKDLV